MFVSLQGFRNQKIGCLREATYMATFKCKRKVKTIRKGGTRMGLPSMAAVAYLCGRVRRQKCNTTALASSGVSRPLKGRGPHECCRH